MEIWIVLAVIAVIALFLISMYNRLVTLRQRVREAWSDIDVQLKRRYDLIPNLVETVKGYASHEKTVFENVTNARANAIAAGQTGSPEQRAQAENILTGALRSVFAVAEAYPIAGVAELSATCRAPHATEDKIASRGALQRQRPRRQHASRPSRLDARGDFGFTSSSTSSSRTQGARNDEGRSASGCVR